MYSYMRSRTKFALEAICLMKVRYFLVAIAVCLMLSVCSGCYGTGYDTPYLCDPVTVEGQAWEDILQEISAFYESTGYFDAVWQEPILSVRGKGTARNIPALTLRFDTVEEQTYVTILQPD